MALIFGRFDRANEQVREAIITLATEQRDKETKTLNMAKLKGPARLIFNYALSQQPDATMQDIAHCVGVLAREAKQLGYVGPHCPTYNVKPRWQALMHINRKGGGEPSDEEVDLTLAEMVVLLEAQPRQDKAISF